MVMVAALGLESVEALRIQGSSHSHYSEAPGWRRQAYSWLQQELLVEMNQIFQRIPGSEHS